MSKTRVPNEYLLSDVGRANQLVNGGLENWQRGSGPFTVNSVRTTDAWVTSIIGTDTLSVLRNAVNNDIGSIVCATCTFVLGSGGGVTALYTNVDAPADGQQIVGRTLSLSIRVRTSTANAVRIGLFNGTAWMYSGFHSGGGAYETLTVPAVLMGAGVNAGQVNVFFAASCTAYIDNAMLVLGSATADYVPLPPADDLARCLRYYEGLFMTPVGGGSDVLIGMNYSTTQAAFAWSFKAEKAVTPTVTLNGPSQAYLVVAPAAYVGVGANSASVTAAARRSVEAILVYGAILTSGQANIVSQNGSGFYWTSEANP